MGGAQPLAATMNGACFLGIDVDPHAFESGWKPGTATQARDLDEALRVWMTREEPAERCQWDWSAIART